MAAGLKAGTVWINTYGYTDVRLPWGGSGESGFGREHGESAIERFHRTEGNLAGTRTLAGALNRYHRHHLRQADDGPMKFCVYGAGAIGGYLAVELALSGQEICVVARGAHLQAIQERGLKLMIHGREKLAEVAASEDPRTAGVQDVVICALKAHQAYDCAPAFAPLLGPATAVLTAMNGIPWWYFYGTGGCVSRGIIWSRWTRGASMECHPTATRDRLRRRARVWSQSLGSSSPRPRTGFIIGEPDEPVDFACWVSPRR